MNEGEVVLAKLDNLQRCVHRIEQRLPVELITLQTEWDTQDVISLNLQRAVQCCVDASSIILSTSGDFSPESMKQCFEMLHQSRILSKKVCDNMCKAVGLRNIIVHEYQSTDWEVVHSVVTYHLDSFRKFSKEILRWVAIKTESKR